jgi:nitronate monooxygenase
LRTRAFDQVRGLAWPEPYTGRAVQNDFSTRWHEGEEGLVDDLAERDRYLEAAEAGDFDTAVIFAGEVLDLVGRVEPAKAILERMGREAEDWLRSAPSSIT